MNLKLDCMEMCKRYKLIISQILYTTLLITFDIVMCNNPVSVIIKRVMLYTYATPLFYFNLAILTWHSLVDI
jgi:hypothetical protein